MHVVNVYIRTHSTDGKDMFMRLSSAVRPIEHV